MTFSPPTSQEVAEYCREIEFSVEPGRFIDYYEMRGWEVKKGIVMKSWKAALRVWKRNQDGYIPPHAQRQASLGSLQFQLEKVEDEIREILRPGGVAYAVAPTGEKKKRYEQLVENRHALKRRIEGYMS